jgi:putative DNA primase/helicase
VSHDPSLPPAAISLPQRPRKKTARHIVAIYDYRDEASALLSQVLRYEPKDFRQRRPDGRGGWSWNLDSVRRVLYRLPELLAADPLRNVFLCEGEKDADRLAALGFVATTAPGGAGKWRPEFSNTLYGRCVVIVPDADEPGRKHAEAVARSLFGIAASVRVVALPKGKDVSDWLDAGGTVRELKRLVAEEPEWRRNGAPKTSTLNEPDSSQATLTIRLSDVRPEELSWIWPGRIPLGKISVLEGDPGLGKSTLALDVAARVTVGRELPDGAACDRGRVLLLSAEDGIGDTIRPRFEAAGGDTHWAQVWRSELLPSLSESLSNIENVIDPFRPRLIVFDPLMAFLGAEVNSWRDQDVRRVLASLATIAGKFEAAILLVRHLNKRSGASAVYRGGGSIGIAGAARSVLLVARDPDEPIASRVLASVKSNLTAPPSSLRFSVEEAVNGAARIEWTGEITCSADQLLAEQDSEEDRSVLEEAAEFLIDLLKNGQLESKKVFSEGRKHGFSDKALRRAKKRLGVKAGKIAFDGPWVWKMPS